MTNGREALLSFHLLAVRSGDWLQPFALLPRGGISSAFGGLLVVVGVSLFFRSFFFCFYCKALHTG